MANDKKIVFSESEKEALVAIYRFIHQIAMRHGCDKHAAIGETPSKTCNEKGT